MPASFSRDAPVVIGGSPPHQRTKSDDSDRTVSSAGGSDDLTPSSELVNRPRHARMPSQPTPYPRGPGAFSLTVKTDDKTATPFSWLKSVVRQARGKSVDGEATSAPDDEVEDAPPTPKVMLPRERKYGHGRTASRSSVRSISFGGDGDVPWAEPATQKAADPIDGCTDGAALIRGVVSGMESR